MLNERQNQILEIIKSKKSISTKKLMKLIYVSESTLRRDLTTMEKKGLILRTHGHASLVESSSTESSTIIRVRTNVREKTKIAQACILFLSENETYFFDSSTTVGYLLPHLNRFRNINVVTNGLNNATILTNLSNIRVYLTGGIVYSKTNSVLGPDTINYIKNFHANTFIFSCGGISLSSGITEASYEQSLVKREMISRSKVHILLADHTKFDNILMCQTTSFDSIDYIITDRKPSDEYIELFQQTGTKLIVAE